MTTSYRTLAEHDDIFDNVMFPTQINYTLKAIKFSLKRAVKHE